MGEGIEDVLETAYTLRNIKAESIPVNFFIPIEGNQLGKYKTLSPEYCLRVLCLYRILNPESEIRIAAGREMHLRSMEVLALYPANSLFLNGYLNAKGSENSRTLQMIKDAGFTIQSDYLLDDLIANESNESFDVQMGNTTKPKLKNLQDLRPQYRQ